ncbi:hypothetical protein SAMD00019534_010660 [Acytostelium subglobosum LB1]|uniref:hypothetical protein n=1 Tax=Acytostelium subglobosum LB1 TaxID=1410327 RepID=UPI0006451D1B|nr:hypothetical protein SAMD00019534_010660 [Acytostelium subglobosum LB1]GAM17891.1 hypothetical protein SAMD00019534_010660 [Acytostelium subglobosum LB1]|eukprot:XP_012758487.1 hypothetical protein SAMD00019534_010660 [Acytostelium subglobosum LB1]
MSSADVEMGEVKSSTSPPAGEATEATTTTTPLTIQTLVDLPHPNSFVVADRIRSMCSTMMEQRGMPQQQHSGDGLTDSATHQTVLSLFMDLKDANRTDQFASEATKGDVDKERQRLDNINQLYQNYVYEKNHLMKEIRSLTEFDIDKDQPVLVSQEYYQSKCAQSVDHSNNEEDVMNGDTNGNNSNRHNDIIQRLNFELEERAQMVEQLVNLEKEKKSMIALNRTKQDFLLSLPKIVSDLSKRLSTLQPSLNSSYNLNVVHLPKPLYMIYTSILSFQSSSKKSDLNIKIQGDMDKAIQFNTTQSSSTSSSSSSTSQVTSSMEDDVQASGTGTSTTTKTDQTKTTTTSLVHPLSLVFLYNISNQVVQLQFQYHVDLNLVSLVSNDISDQLHTNLFPDDTIDLAAECAGSGTTPPPVVNGRLYRWVQVLAGLMQCPTQSIGNQWSFVSYILSMIEKRIAVTQKLKKQVSLLKKQVVSKPSNDHRFSMTLFEEVALHRHTVALASFRLVFQNANAEIHSNVIITESSPIFTIRSKALKQDNNNNNNNNATSNYLLLEKETIKSIESELNLHYMIEDQTTRMMEAATLVDQIDKLKSILNFLGEPLTSIQSKTVGRFRRGKLRSLPLSFDTSSQQWSHK